VQAVLRNVRYAIRVLGRTPGFTITVVLTLALAIGANGVVFSALDAVLLRPLGFPEADRLVRVSESRQQAAISNTAPVRIEEWNNQTTSFAAITGYYTEDVSETSGDLPERFRRARVAPRFLEVWGVAPAIGRGFLPAENQPGAAPVALISHRYWSTRLDRDPKVLGRALKLGNEQVAIVGVMPESFRFPDRSIDIWIPLTYEAFVLQRFSLWLTAYGRLKPGVSLERARADLSAVQARAAEQFPETDRNVGVYVAALKDTTVGAVRGSLWLLFGAVTVLLLIASTNIAALLLSRAASRRHEISVRLSLGAPRRAIAAQVLTETAVLAAAGTILGVALAAGGSSVLAALVPNVPRIDEIAFGGPLLAFAAAAAIGVTFLCGLLPAIRSAHGDVGHALAAGRRTQVAGRHALQWLFVGVQVTLSVVLLAGAGLLGRSFLELTRVDPGFEPARVLSFRISGTFDDFGSLADNIENILAELRMLPGVEAAATGSPVPGMVTDGSGFQFGVGEYELQGRTEEQKLLANFRVVSPSYFDALRIPLLAGEPCRSQPVDSEQNLVVNEAFVARYLVGSSIVGGTLRGGQNPWSRVTGVVGNAREYSLTTAAGPAVYRCQANYATPALSFLLRTQADPAALVPAVREKIKQLEPLRAVYDVTPLSERIGDQYTQDRLRSMALALFAATALALACLGVYGTLSYVVSLRRREVGLRIALGAVEKDIVSQFLGRAMRVVGFGCALGLGVSLATSRLLAGMLFGVSPWDPLTLAAVVVVVTAVGAIAALIPAARASRVPPMVVLREE
jgi:putative ABC transport system permease protein